MRGLNGLLTNSLHTRGCINSPLGVFLVLTKKKFLLSIALVAVVALGIGVYLTADTWGEVNRVSIERDPAPTDQVPVAQDDDPASAPGDEPVSEPDDPGLQAILLVGSDSRDQLDDLDGFGDFGGTRADVVMVLLKNGTDTALLSLPRDLLVDDPCTGESAKLGAMLEGCASMNGPSLLVVTVESLIGEPIDHFAMVDLAGFQEAVDAVGGYEICLETSVRDSKANLELPAGCTLASGAQTLAWMRSRRTQELTDSGWKTMSGINDLVRNERQRAFLIDMMGRLSDVTSPQDMAAIGQTVAPFVTVDSELGFVDAVNLALTMRGLGSGSIVELDVPVYDATLEGGAAVLLPSVPVNEIVAEFLTTELSGQPVTDLGA